MKMKKLLGFIALAVLVILPIKASAATYGIAFEKTEETDDYFVVTIKAKQDTANTFTAGSYSATMTIKEGAQYVEGSATGNGNWAITVSGNQIIMTLGTGQTELEAIVGTLKFNKIASTNCDVLFECNGKTTTVTPSTPNNPKTGNALPYAVIAVGMGIAGAVYYVTRKNTKLYKI